MQKRYLLNLAYALLLNGIIIVLIYLWTQPDPKGIGFWILLFEFACVQGVLAVMFLIYNFPTRKFMYSFVLWGNSTFLYFLFQMVESLNNQQNSISFGFGALHLIISSGIILFIWLSLKFLIAFLKAKEQTVTR